MASVADKIVAAPFAQLGSIGVIMIAPNFSERLKREGIEVYKYMYILKSQVFDERILKLY